MKTENAAFGDYGYNEIARILRCAAERIEDGELVSQTEFSLMDINGNKVGTVEMT